MNKRKVWLWIAEAVILLISGLLVAGTRFGFLPQQSGDRNHEALFPWSGAGGGGGEQRQQLPSRSNRQRHGQRLDA